MKSLWDDGEARAFRDDPLALRVYTSRLLGRDETLVMHGGGNTSVKHVVTDFFGREVETLSVKGSGWDLKTIEAAGFAPLRLNETCLLAERETLTDDDMARQLRSIMLDQSAPSPSVEAILHAILPFRYVDHTHADAAVTLTNTPDGERLAREVWPDCLVLPYVMPGFILSKQVYDAIQGVDLASVAGIILLHHGVFTFADDAKTSYEKMIELVGRAEAFLETNGQVTHPTATSSPDLLELAGIRRAVSEARGAAQLAVLDSSPEAAGFVSRADIGQIANRGPITPDHVIRTKRVPVILAEAAETHHAAIGAFVDAYTETFERHRTDGLTMLDPAPRWGVWQARGTIAFGSSPKECAIVTDIARHTAWAIQTGESLGGWAALSEAELFELEYWVLEQAKLAKKGAARTHQGKVALVSGAAGGIGLATARRLHADGAAVVGIDIDPSVTDTMLGDGLAGVVCDVTNERSIREAVDGVIRRFGGLDLLVCNAGIFRTGEMIEVLRDTWDRTMDVNLTATQRLMAASIPYLKLGVDPSIVVIGSRNVPGPGAGAAAYSVSKAGVTQLARVAALELASAGVRVNVVHPDAVFDTALWTEEVLERSASRYGMTVDEYKRKNLLGREITSADVAAMVSAVAGPVFGATTGAQIPIDGGSERVI